MVLDLSLSTTNTDYWKELEAFILPEYQQKVKDAYEFASMVHQGKLRATGRSAMEHTVWVSKVVAQLGIGLEAIVAAVIHDCLDDDPSRLEVIAQNFGDEVALLVDGISDVRKKTQGVKMIGPNIDIYRKFILSSVTDVRILIIRIVDKLHDGMNIKYLPIEKQLNYGQRVFGLYSPVAEYVGLNFFKRLLDDMAFEIVYPNEALETKKLIASKNELEKVALEKVENKITELLELNRISEYKISSRIKSLFGTYKKFIKHKTDGDKDRVGVRILTDKLADCYTVLGLIHSTFSHIEDEFDDYIAKPKSNGYRSIQTTIIWNEQIKVEVQIRTKDMHEFNEFGPAAHVAYKMGKMQVSNKDGYEWVRELVGWKRSPEGVSNYTINVLRKFVYVFTPAGDTIQLPIESTVLDFAYRLHTDVGDRCKGVLVNGKIVKLNEKLKTGDLVEVLVGNKNNVTKKWLDFVTTPNAKEHIRKMTNIGL